MELSEPIKDPKTPEDASLVARIENVVKDYFTAMETRLTKMIDEKTAAIVKAKEAEVELALRKSLGVEQDPVIHVSDLDKFLRKYQLEKADLDKTSPKNPEKHMIGPDGNDVLLKSTSTSAELDNLLREYGVKEAKK